MARVLAIYGTRPEAVKVAPVVKSLRDSGRHEPVVAVTGQHPHLVDQIHRTLQVEADLDLRAFEPGQPLASMTAKVMERASAAIAQVRPELVLVQGDTTSAFAAGMAAFYADVPLVHLEAGLRTGSRRAPFPEEMNRSLLGWITDLHLAPTVAAKQNLVGEGVAGDRVVVTGNTVIDALQEVLRISPPLQDRRLAEILTGAIDGARRPGVVTVTTHRRESWGAPMEEIFTAVSALARKYPDHQFVIPLHPNPLVRSAARTHLARRPNLHTAEPLCYPDFCRLMAASTIVMTDSGGVQEEAPSLGVPVIVLRDTTERREAVTAGTAVLAGTRASAIIRCFSELVEDEERHGRMARSVNPYGDGHAAPRCVAAIDALTGCGERFPDFVPEPVSALVAGL
ncbi:non-hydrolyzing UDP-N-acetylglucosamine 2-epimerase [Streptomyces sp. NPDC054794]